MTPISLDDPATIERLLGRLLGSARRRASRSKFDFDLEIDDIRDLWRSQEGRCAVSGLLFSMMRFPQALVKHPYGPSLDRIDSYKGYVRGNVRVVCTAVNFGLGQWGDEVFLTIARATVHRQMPIVDADRRLLGERIEAAEAILPLLNEAEAKRQRRRIAALKRARTLGADGLSLAAKRARATRLHIP
jgi:hypothetical protein